MECDNVKRSSCSIFIVSPYFYFPAFRRASRPISCCKNDMRTILFHLWNTSTRASCSLLPKRSSLFLPFVRFRGTEKKLGALTCPAATSSSATHAKSSALLARLPASCQPYVALARLDKPIGFWLLYWPGAWSIQMAAANVASTSSSLDALAASTPLLALFLSGAVVMRGAGCIINDLWDRQIDQKVMSVALRVASKRRPCISCFMRQDQQVNLHLLSIHL